jgi:hypothetical protein
VELLVHNSIYLSTGPERNKCYVQLSGEPLCDLKLVDRAQLDSDPPALPAAPKVTNPAVKGRLSHIKPLEILLPRNKIFYAQTKLQDGRAAFKRGLPRHRELDIKCELTADVLNAITSQTRGLPSDTQCRTLLKHVFPLQFGLKNVFCQSAVSRHANRNAVLLSSGNRKRDIKVREYSTSS